MVKYADMKPSHASHFITLKQTAQFQIELQIERRKSLGKVDRHTDDSTFFNSKKCAKTTRVMVFVLDVLKLL